MSKLYLTINHPLHDLFTNKQKKKTKKQKNKKTNERLDKFSILHATSSRTVMDKNYQKWFGIGTRRKKAEGMWGQIVMLLSLLGRLGGYNNNTCTIHTSWWAMNIINSVKTFIDHFKILQWRGLKTQLLFSKNGEMSSEVKHGRQWLIHTCTNR